MKYCFIVNPQAGKGKGRKTLEQLKSEIPARQLDAEILVTKASGHATQLSAATEASIVVAVGGDGTINEVVNGIVGSTKTLGILPCGSGNDLIKSIGIPADFNSALQKLFSEQIREVDCATVQCTGANPVDPTDSRYFINGVGIGFDAAVAEQTTKSKYFSGTTLYVLSVFQTLGKYVSPTFTVSLDAESRSSRNLLIAIGNGRCAGGGFYLTPDARIDDGYLDVCMIEDRSVLGILAIMPKVIAGKHVNEKGVSIHLAKNISVDALTPFFVHADGEMVGRNVKNVAVNVIEKGLKIIGG